MKSYFLRQVLPEKRTRIGKISRRPASISKLRTSLDRVLKALKLQVGPTASRPGPMLLKQASTAVKLVVTEKLEFVD